MIYHLIQKKFTKPVLLLWVVFLSLVAVNLHAQSAEEYFIKGNKYALSGKFDSAEIFLNKSIKYAAIEHDTASTLKAMNTLAQHLLENGDWEQAKTTLEDADLLAQEYADTLLWSTILENKSRVYGTVGKTDYKKSLEILLEAARLQEEHHAWNRLASVYRSISVVFKEMKNLEKREEYLLKAAKLIEENLINSAQVKAQIYNELGRYYSDENIDYSKAESYYIEVKEICEKIDWKKGIAVSLTNIAYVKEQEGKLEEALALQLEALTIKQELNYSYGLINSYHSIGDLLIKLNRINKAINYLKKAENRAKEETLVSLNAGVSQSLYKAYKIQGNYELALHYQEVYSALSDSIKSIEHTKIIEELNTKYETRQKEQRINELEHTREIERIEAKNRRSKLLTLIAALLFLIALGTMLYFRRLGLNKEKEAELNQKLLRSQMNPHFIFNSLNSINAYIIGNKAAEAGIYLSRFAKLMRNILECSREEKIPLEQEIETLNYYLQLEQLRFENKFSFTIEVDEKIDCFDIEIPPMMLQPFVENAIKHAFRIEKNDNKIEINFTLQNEKTLACTVRDNGIGLFASKGSKHKSYATNITKERINSLKQKGKQKITLHSTDLSEKGARGTEVNLTIPV